MTNNSDNRSSLDPRLRALVQLPTIAPPASPEKKKVELEPLFSRASSAKSDASDINEKKFLSTLEVANEKI